jgi:hypothetical protein
MSSIAVGLSEIAKLMMTLGMYRKEKRRIKFEKVYDPIFTEFMAIHSDYVDLINAAIRVLGFIEIYPDKYPEQETRNRLLSLFEEKRKNYEGVRTKIRSESKTYIEMAKTCEERYFLYSVLCYFLAHDLPFKTRDDMESGVNLLLKYDHHTVFRTPSTRVFQKLKDESDRSKLVKYLLGERDGLVGYLNDVCGYYAGLKLLIYK